MLKEFVEKLLELKNPEVIDLHGLKHFKAGYTRFQQPLPPTVQVTSLQAIVDYLKGDPDEVKGVPLILHVVDADEVVLRSALEKSYQVRAEILRASLDNHGEGFQFGRFHDVEQFVVALSSQFKATDQQKGVLKIVGNLQAEKVTTSLDDGVTQTVASRQGIALGQKVELPNPVRLAPFRTFREVDQPASDFLLRVKQNRETEMPTVALYEADGGAWRLEAISNISTFFQKAGLGTKVTIVA